MNRAANTEETNASAIFECRSSLIFLTHPTVVKELGKIAKQKFQQIQTSEGAIVWAPDEAGNAPFIKDDIGIKRYRLVFGGSVSDAEFGPRILAKGWGASMTRIKRPGAPPSGQPKAKKMYQEPEKDIVPETAPIGKPYIPAKGTSKVKKVGDVKAYISKEERDEGGPPETFAVADTIAPGGEDGQGEEVRVAVPIQNPGNAAEVEQKLEQVADVARENVLDTMSATLRVAVEQINSKIQELEQNETPESQQELIALRKKRQEFNGMLAKLSKF